MAQKFRDSRGRLSYSRKRHTRKNAHSVCNAKVNRYKAFALERHRAVLSSGDPLPVFFVLVETHQVLQFPHQSVLAELSAQGLVDERFADLGQAIMQLAAMSVPFQVGLVSMRLSRLGGVWLVHGWVLQVQEGG